MSTSLLIALICVVILVGALIPCVLSNMDKTREILRNQKALANIQVEKAVLRVKIAQRNVDEELAEQARIDGVHDNVYVILSQSSYKAVRLCGKLRTLASYGAKL